MSDKKLPSDLSRSKISQEINLDELLTKSMKRVYDLIEKPLDRFSEIELNRRILEINVSRKEGRSKRVAQMFSFSLEVFDSVVGSIWFPLEFDPGRILLKGI